MKDKYASQSQTWFLFIRLIDLDPNEEKEKLTNWDAFLHSTISLLYCYSLGESLFDEKYLTHYHYRTGSTGATMPCAMHNKKTTE